MPKPKLYMSVSADDASSFNGPITEGHPTPFRHYTLATEYSRGPPHMLSTVPSMIELGDGQSHRRSRRCHERAGGAQCWRRYSPSKNAQEKAVEDDEVMLMVHVPLAMFGLTMFFDRFALSFFDCFSIDEGGCIRWHWDYCD